MTGLQKDSASAVRRSPSSSVRVGILHPRFSSNPFERPFQSLFVAIRADLFGGFDESFRLLGIVGFRSRFLAHLCTPQWAITMLTIAIAAVIMGEIIAIASAIFAFLFARRASAACFSAAEAVRAAAEAVRDAASEACSAASAARRAVSICAELESISRLDKYTVSACVNSPGTNP